MKRHRLLLGLLVASLALNLAFAVSYFLQRRKAHAPRPRVEALLQIQQELKLNPAQQRTVDGLLRKFKIESLILKEDIQEKRVEILEEIGNPDYLPDTVREKVKALNALENRLNDAFMEMLLQVSEVLDPEQRLVLISRLGEDWYSFQRRRPQGGVK